jgi:nicotinate-nucleotide adenylyltransferase
MTTGILGGAFDPPHRGHVALAAGAIDRFRLDRLVVLVVAAPAHRPVAADLTERLELARAALADLPGAHVVPDHHAYTIDFLRSAGHDPDDTLFVVGADELANFLGWKEPDAILELVRLAVGTRPGYPRERLDAVLARLSRPERVELFEIQPVETSSTEVRARLARGEPIADLLPPAVADRVVELGLYDADVDPDRSPELC